MLPGHRRIRKGEEFRAVLRGPARAGSSTMIVHVGPVAPDSGEPARAGLIVGRSVGGAVVRNRVKRRLRHDLAELLVEVPDGWGVVVRAKQASGTVPASVLATDLAAALRRCLVKVGQRPMTPVVMSQ